jgi:hypothetical protein
MSRIVRPSVLAAFLLKGRAPRPFTVSMNSCTAPSAVSSALGGISAASKRLDASAAKLVSEGLERGDTVSLSEAARQASTGGGEVRSIASAMVDLRIAKYQSAASVAVLRTADDMTRDVLSIAGKR